MKFFNSVKALYSAVGILFITVAIGYYLDTKNDNMYVNHLEINLGLEKMVRLNQELAGMLLLSVVEQNTLRTTRYDTVYNDSQDAISKIAVLTKSMVISQEITTLIESRDKIYALEETAIRLMRSDKWKEARDILFGDEYSITKKTYEIDIESVSEAILGEVAVTEKSFNRIKTASLFIRISALFFLLWTGIMFSRRTRADLAEQVRLQTQISAANKLLEERVHERTEELRLLLHSAGEGMFGIDAAGQITFINPVALNLLGFGEDEMIGKDVHSLIHQSHPDGSRYHKEDCPMNATCISGIQNHVTDEVLWRKDGSSFPVEYSSTPIIKDGKAIGAVVTFRDTTKRVQAEKELKEQMDELERFNRLTIDREEKMIQL
ncbi:MAG: domain S-box protein, partial [Thermodesulfobacteriota bacterium]|nr:domain S-box protein [Thermodesulfobacteriota bacterium]